MKLGVIGCAGIADRRTIPGILLVPEIEITAVCDRTMEIAERIACKYGVPQAFDSVAGLLESGVDAVYVATPVYLHHEHCIAAARAGKHVLVEKPIAMNSWQALEIVETCRRHDVVLSEGYMMKFHPLHVRARDMLVAGALGKPVLLRGQLSCWYPPIEGAWRQVREQGGGGALIDMASHLYDLFEWICGPIASVCACVANLEHDYETEDTAVTMVRFANGACGVVDSLFNVPDASVQNRLEIYGTRGSLLADGTVGQGTGGEMLARLDSGSSGYDAAQARTDDGSVQVAAPQLDSLYAAEFRHFLDAIAGRTEPISGGANAWRMMKVIEAAYESARLKRWVDVG